MSESLYSALPNNPQDSAAFVVRTPSDAPWVQLPFAPRLESWMAGDHPDSVRLREFVDDALPRIGPYIQGTNCGLELDVRLPDATSLISGGRDLDNYLFPLIYRMPTLREQIVSVFAAKSHGAQSRIRAGAVRDEPPPLTGWSFAGTEASGATGSAVWRDQVIANLAPAPPKLPAGPLEMQITLRGSRSNWHQNWKATIDGMGAILGLERSGHHADDSRITRLRLHRMVDPSLGPRTLIGVWWRSAELT